MVLYMYIWSTKIFVSFLLGIMSIFNHPHYVGVTELEYVAERKQLQIACKWFADDLEEALKSSGIKYDMSVHYKEIGQDTVILSYIKKHLRISIDGNSSDMFYVGAEMEKGSLWTYWSIKDLGGFKSVRFTNNIFCDKHADQIHLVHYTQNKIRESRKLTCKEPTTTFIWK